MENKTPISSIGFLLNKVISWVAERAWTGQKITSEFKDGVLEISMPKTEEVKPKEIEIPVK